MTTPTPRSHPGRALAGALLTAALLLAGCGPADDTDGAAGQSGSTIDNGDNGDNGDSSRNTGNRGVPFDVWPTKIAGARVTSKPGGIDCGSVCSTRVREGTSVTLTATAGPGVRFVSWGGACSGTAPTCTVVVAKPSSIRATFEATNGAATTSVPTTTAPSTTAAPTTAAPATAAPSTTAAPTTAPPTTARPTTTAAPTTAAPPTTAAGTYLEPIPGVTGTVFTAAQAVANARKQVGSTRWDSTAYCGGGLRCRPDPSLNFVTWAYTGGGYANVVRAGPYQMVSTMVNGSGATKPIAGLVRSGPPPAGAVALYLGPSNPTGGRAMLAVGGGKVVGPGVTKRVGEVDYRNIPDYVGYIPYSG